MSRNNYLSINTHLSLFNCNCIVLAHTNVLALQMIVAAELVAQNVVVAQYWTWVAIVIVLQVAKKIVTDKIAIAVPQDSKALH